MKTIRLWRTALEKWLLRWGQTRKDTAQTSKLPSGLPACVEDGEFLARFLTQSNQFSQEKRIAKPAAFLPDAKGERSVFRHGKEPRDRLWALAGIHLKPGKPVRGAAILAAHDVRAAALDVIASEPPPRHANIIGWPSESDPQETKAKQKEKALTLVARATLVLREDD